MGSGQADGTATHRGWRGWWPRRRGQTAADDALPEIPSALDLSGVWLLGEVSSAPVAAREGILAGSAPVIDLDSAPLPVVHAPNTAPVAHAHAHDLDGHEPDATDVPALSAAHAASGSAVVRGTLSLIMREGLLRVVVLVANAILANILAPEVFGVFVILGFFNTFLTTFGAFGLGPAIVQRREEPTRHELAALFTFQLIIAVLLSSLAMVLAPWLVALYHLDAPEYALGAQAVWLVRVMALSFILISVAATPMALLERRLAFGRIALIEVSSGVAYQVVAVVLAIQGAGAWALVIATLVSAGVWLSMVYLAEHWMPRISLRWRAIWPLVRFGVQYQVNSFISLVKDNIASTFVAALLGATALGFINWATTLAFYPLVVVQLMGRVTFPAFARALDDRPRLQRMVEATIRYQCYVAYPAVAVLTAFIPQIATIVFGHGTAKWLPAVPLVYFFLIPTVASAATSPLIAGLNALGRPDIVWRLMLMWLVLDWALGVTFVLRFGTVGFAVANALVALSSVVTVLVFKHYLPVRLRRNIVPPAISMALTTGIFLLVARLRTPAGMIELALACGAVFVVFALLEMLIDRHFVADARYVLVAIFARLWPRSEVMEVEAKAVGP